MELRVNDYVRTKDGIIGKVIKEQPFMNDILIFLDNKQGNITYQSKDGVFKVNHKEDIINSSPNIIDIFEVGDYVNGYYVEDITNTGEELVLHIITGSNYFQSPFLYNEDIKSILTHEQFEAMKYVVGEE